jgi:hypothetical protein
MVTASRLDCYTESYGVLINENFQVWSGVVGLIFSE